MTTRGPLGDDLMDALVEFHFTYGCPVRPTPVARPDEWELRVDLLREEWCEYVAAVEQGDVVEVADALADMAYVIFGTALSYGIDLPAVLAEVHRSNMSKVGADGKPVLREDGKILKGPDFFRPDIAAVLAGQDRLIAVATSESSSPVVTDGKRNYPMDDNRRLSRG